MPLSKASEQKVYELVCPAHVSPLGQPEILAASWSGQLEIAVEEARVFEHKERDED